MHRSPPLDAAGSPVAVDLAARVAVAVVAGVRDGVAVVAVVYVSGYRPG